MPNVLPALALLLIVTTAAPSHAKQSLKECDKACDQKRDACVHLLSPSSSDYMKKFNACYRQYHQCHAVCLKRG